MTQRERALQLLARVGASDRQWILQQLSAPARASLTSPPRSEPAPQPVARDELGEVRDRLNCAAPTRLVELLCLEPAWLVSAVLNAHGWPWAKEFLAALPPTFRFEISHLERRRVRLAPAAIAFVLRNLAARLGTSCLADSQPSRFESLLRRLRRKATR